MADLTTLIYLKRDDCYLMLHRVSKKNDINKDKWLGIGGHFEHDESPFECVKRETKEETGYDLITAKFRGIVTFVAYNNKEDFLNKKDGICEYVHVFTSEDFKGDEVSSGINFSCDEGKLKWVPIKEVYNLPIWEGDKLFLRAIEEDRDVFNLKLVYIKDELVEAKFQ